MTNCSDLVSVIIPAYNAELFISETIDSVLAQSYKHIEIIVIDDGSSDNTLAIANTYKDRITILTQKNMGVSTARNYGAKKAQGKWLAFIDADDIWLPNKIEQQLEKIGTESWSHTNSYYFGEQQSGDVTRSDLTPQHDGLCLQELLADNFITTSTVLIKKSTFWQYQGFDESLPVLEDWKLWLTISAQEPLHYLAQPLAKYRVFPGSTSRKARKVYPVHLALIDYAFDNFHPDETTKSQKITQAKANSSQICSYIAEDAKDHSFALKCAYYSLTYQPLNIQRWKRLIRCLLNSRLLFIKD